MRRYNEHARVERLPESHFGGILVFRALQAIVYKLGFVEVCDLVLGILSI